MTTDRLFDVEALRDIADRAYDYPRDPDGYVKVPHAVWEQCRADLLAAADELDLRALEARRTA